MIVQAAVTMLVLLGMSAFVVDYGVLWVGRAQAQNAADAGAVAGGIARAYDNLDPGPPGSSGIIMEIVQQTVQANPVWFEAASLAPLSFVCPPNVAGGGPCVRVDVFRDDSPGSNPLPTFFGPVLGIESQGVRATATAQVAVGNGTNCLKPWAIPDKWIEGSLPPNDNFERYVEGGASAGATVTNPDVYDPPTVFGPGSGLTFGLGNDLGLPITLSFADPDGSEPISAGFLLPLVLPGANTYEENISRCNGRLVSFGQEVETGSAAMEVATAAGFAGLITISDPGASWDAVTKNVQGGCAPGCAPISPRLVALAVFDVDRYQFSRATGWACVNGGARCVNVVNIVGFFLDHVEAGGVAGYIARYPGLVSPDDPTLSAASSFLPAITLVR